MIPLLLLFTLRTFSCNDAFVLLPSNIQRHSRAAIHHAQSMIKLHTTMSNFTTETTSEEVSNIASEAESLEEESKKKYIYIYDTSLRDGTQGESVSVSCEDKLKIANKLSNALKVDFIEAGWPGSNPKDIEFFTKSQTVLDDEIKQKLTAFGSTRRKGIKNIEDDRQIMTLIESKAPTICMVAKSHLKQVEDILRTTDKENLNMIYDSVYYCKQIHKRKVFVDLEHFFDGFIYDKAYILQCCDVAIDAGVDGLVLCDTNGGTMPWDIHDMTKEIVDLYGDKAIIGIHCHNDCGMAVANSLSAVQAGATMIQGTINGIGERTGNADLCSIVPSLLLHMNYTSTCKSALSNITTVSRFVDEVLNRNPNPAAPFVGQSAFAHKGGLHVAAMERDEKSYQHIDPTLVGNEKRVLISELSGRQNILDKIKESGVSFGDQTSERALAILNRVKSLESIGYTFEGADASVHLMILHMSKEYCPPFRVLDYSTTVFDFDLDSASRVLGSNSDDDSVVIKDEKSARNGARATVLVRAVQLDDKVCDENAPYTDRLEVSDGNGPVDALAKALIRALQPSHPVLADIELVDYKVRILDPEKATGAATRVMIEFKNKVTDELWTTVSVDRNVISASLNALIDGFEYALLDYIDNAECIVL